MSCLKIQQMFYTIILIILIALGALFPSTVVSSFLNHIVIENTGHIIIRTRTKVKTVHCSEVRGIFFHGANYGHNRMDANWTLIAQTVSQYGITDVFVDLGGLPEGSLRAAMLPNILNAFHPLGIRVHVAWNVLIGGRTSPYEMRAQDSSGNFIGWGCPIRVRNFIKDSVQTIASYDIDGFMFDYIRYWDVNTDMCFCQQCRAAFQDWLGENITDWTQFYPGGSRHEEFLIWRNEPINELVGLIRNWTLEVNPDLEFSAAVFPIGDNCPIYWKKYLGQDAANWIKNGYLDFLCPMTYTNNTAEIEMRISNYQRYWTAGKEGKIPLIVLITNGINRQFSVEEFKAVVNKVREMGADGWIVWRYGGPGNSPSDADRADIRPYLDALEWPEVFNIYNIQVFTSETGATITWVTDAVTTSRVEYSTTPLFGVEKKMYMNFPYWNITYTPGVIIEDNTLVKFHNISLKGLYPATTYYFRVQSKGKTGTVTVEIQPDSIRGKVRVESRIWSATSDHVIPVGTKIQVVGHEGVHLKVQEVEAENQTPESSVPPPPSPQQESESQENKAG